MVLILAIFATAQHSTVQYSRVQYSTVEFSLVQSSTWLHDCAITKFYLFIEGGYGAVVRHWGTATASEHSTWRLAVYNLYMCTSSHSNNNR